MNPLAVVLMLAMLATAGVLFVGLLGFFVGGSFNELLAVMALGLLFLSQG